MISPSLDFFDIVFLGKTMTSKEIVPPTIAAIGAVVAGKIIDHIDTLKIIAVWQDLFLDIWYVWLGVGVFGLSLLGHFLLNLHRNTKQLLNIVGSVDEQAKVVSVLPVRITDIAQRIEQVSAVLDKEMLVRDEQDQKISTDFNNLQIGITTIINHTREQLRTESSEAIQKETNQRIDGINALLRDLNEHFERLSNIETFLPREFSEGTKALETKLTAQIAALNKRMDKAEPPSALDLGTATGIINSFSPAPTHDEMIVQAIADRTKNKK